MLMGLPKQTFLYGMPASSVYVFTSGNQILLLFYKTYVDSNTPKRFYF